MVIATKGIDWDELVQPTRVHGSLYYDPDIFEAELQKIWYRDWIFVGHESEVNDAGDYATRQIGLEPVIMTRDERGKIHLLLNRCVHRGATVCQLESGNASAFRCAYHGWTYRNTGELIGVPFDRAYPVSFRIDHPSLITVPRVASYRGFVFGSMSPDGLDLVEFLGGAREAIIDRLCDLSPEGEIEIRSAWVKDRTQCNWKTALDNPWGAGADHSQFTHRSVPRRSRTMPSRGVASESVPAFVEKGVREPSAESEFTDFTEWKGHDLDHGHIWTVGGADASGAWVDIDNPHPAEKRYVAMMIDHHGEERARKMLRDGPSHATLWPGLFFPSNSFHVHVPVSPTETISMFNFPFLKGAPEVFNERHFRRFEGAFGPAGMIVGDDFEVWERIQRALVAERGEEWIDMSKGLAAGDEEAWLARGGVVMVDESGHHNEFGGRHVYDLYKKMMTRP